MRFPFAGIIVPLLTPLTSGDNVDKPALRALIRHCPGGGVDGLFVGGTAGLGPLLTEPDWLQAGAIAPAHLIRIISWIT
jgi:dihydrodipicolinate synthase/N-acetylneuraminate lyase